MLVKNQGNSSYPKTHIFGCHMLSFRPYSKLLPYFVAYNTRGFTCKSEPHLSCICTSNLNHYGCNRNSLPFLSIIFHACTLVMFVVHTITFYAAACEFYLIVVFSVIVEKDWYAYRVILDYDFF